ncbi:MAG: hypothetical protein A3I01_16525 [Betaproteobacteria bacterium RIFCSPLOWO2_02_FULL_65_24]|nr:MAG: hypothetical protein A3I01_16525 [Betaproteobacteria bacterium RIFCSPLOWO2_02_FULL_65_24]
MTATYVIVGGGYAGNRAADCLRRAGFSGRIALVSEEAYLPYHRTPLSKQFLAGPVDCDRLLLRHAPYYERQQVTLHLKARATSIDRAGKRLRLADQRELPYDRLMLCLGARARALDIPGKALAGIHYLRTMDDARALRTELAACKRLVVVGAGYIGLELAATARRMGRDVTVLESEDRPMSRVVAPLVSEFFARRHAEAGVKLHCGVQVSAFAGKERVRAVITGEGREIPADLVVVGIGNVPETALAAAAGIECDDGIVVDAQCRTSDPHIYAAGDCARAPSVRYGARVRLESVDNALEQGRVAAATMCGVDGAQAAIPWFWSDQYDVKLQIAGLAEGFDTAVARGDPGTNAFSVWHLRGGELLAMNAINRAADFMLARKWIAARRRLDPERLADMSLPLNAM